MRRWNRRWPRGVLAGMTPMWPLRALLGAVVAGALALAPTSAAVACSCGMGSIADSLAFADIVFTGRATAVVGPEPKPIRSTADPVDYHFAVDQVFKGPLVGPEVVATTAVDGASCGTTFAIDERWLVFATVQDGELWTGLCSGNVLLVDDAAEAEVLAAIGPPIATPEMEERAPAGGGLELPIGLLVAVAIGGVVLGVSGRAFLREPSRGAR